ncbi:hypothetical protein, partial [Treponema saccharophilum]|uniref:hypothetical protein n=1 Tax=Treponema saccharophilum TaxID=165 RepID=UPI00386EC0D2
MNDLQKHSAVAGILGSVAAVVIFLSAASFLSEKFGNAPRVVRIHLSQETELSDDAKKALALSRSNPNRIDIERKSLSEQKSDSRIKAEQASAEKAARIAAEKKAAEAKGIAKENAAKRKAAEAAAAKLAKENAAKEKARLEAEKRAAAKLAKETAAKEKAEKAAAAKLAKETA